jgi:putative transposase
MRLKAFKYRIYPNRLQAETIRKNCGCRRFVYNWGLEIKQKAFLTGKRLSHIDLANMLPDLKKVNPWLKEVNSQSLQAALKDLDAAYNRFFDKQNDFPKFKSKSKSKDSFHIPQHFIIDSKTGIIKLPKLGNVKTIFDREPDGEVRSITISISKSGKFFASVLCQQKIDILEPKPIDPATTIGIDVGLKSFAVVSDGRVFKPNADLKASRKRIEYLSRQLSRKIPKGSNRNKARIKLARAYEKRANQQRDFLHKLSHQLTSDENQVGTICVEDLNIKGMLGNHCLARSISEVAWGEFYRQLEYKCPWKGINLIKIGRFEPSSKLCPCGFRNNSLQLSDREWTCPSCGTKHDRDRLASNNIKTMGLAKIKMAVGTTVTKLGEPSGSKRKLRTKKLGKISE